MESSVAAQEIDTPRLVLTFQQGSVASKFLSCQGKGCEFKNLSENPRYQVREVHLPKIGLLKLSSGDVPWTRLTSRKTLITFIYRVLYGANLRSAYPGQNVEGSKVDARAAVTEPSSTLSGMCYGRAASGKHYTALGSECLRALSTPASRCGARLGCSPR